MNKTSVAAILMACMVGAAVAAAPSVDNARVDAMVKQFAQMQGQDIPNEQMAQVKEQAKVILQQQDVLKQEAVKLGLDKQPEIQAMVQNAEAQVYAAAYVEQLRDNVTVDEAELLTTFRQMTRELKLQAAEYDSRDAAVKAQQLLLKGATFADLAKTLPAEQKEGVAGTWLPAMQLTQLPAAVSGLVKGQITAEPVELNGKFYLFRIADERAAQDAPPFEQIKAQLANEVKQRKVDEQIQQLFKANGLDMAAQQQ